MKDRQEPRDERKPKGRRKPGGRQKPKGRITVLMICLAAAVILAGGLYMASQHKGDKNPDTGTAAQGDSPGGGTVAMTPEQKAEVEAQTGVTVNDDNTMTVDIGAIMEEEESVPVSREEAQTKIAQIAGEGSEVTSLSIRENNGEKYWAVQAEKDGQTYDVWISAQTGEEYLFQ